MKTGKQIRPKGLSYWIMPAITPVDFKPSDIIRKVSVAMGVDVENMLGKSKKREFADARHVVFYLVKKYCRDSNGETLKLYQIGDELNKAHCSVLHGCNNVENRLSYDNKFVSLIDEIERRLTDSVKFTNRKIDDETNE